jgi:predicted RNA-binding Zn ribbon-like protein
MTAQGPSPFESKLVAGELCLDFANTVDWHASDHPEECLGSYEDLVAWCRRVGLIDEAGGEILLRQARRHPQAARTALRRAITLRETIYRIVLAILGGLEPEASDLDRFNRELGSALQHLRVASGGEGLEWIWEGAGRALDWVLWPILRSAGELLTSERQERIGQCADDRGCGWLFLDKTRNHSRRWCEMNDCGNRAKARRHYLRKHPRSPGRRR